MDGNEQLCKGSGSLRELFVPFPSGLPYNIGEFHNIRSVSLMARTKTQKALRQAERAGTWSAAMMRKTNEDYSSLSQHVRVKPTKQEQLHKVKHRKRIGDDGAFFVGFGGCDIVR